MLAKIKRKLESYSAAKTSREILWSSVFRDTVAGSPWLIHKNFSPGRWAAGYPMLYIVYRVLNDVKPSRILEFGLGESTKITYQYARHHKSSLTVVEQDRDWLDFFSDEVFDVKENTRLCPLEKRMEGRKESNIYGGLKDELKGEQFDFIIVDGPWGSPANSRPQMLDVVMENIDPADFIVILDDYNRKGEKQTFNKCTGYLKRSGIEYRYGVYRGMKDTVILCSPNYHFLCSL